MKKRFRQDFHCAGQPLRSAFKRQDEVPVIMQLTRLTAIPRLSIKALNSLIDRRAEVTCYGPYPLFLDNAAVGRIESVQWRKNRIVLRGCCSVPNLEIGFEDAQPIPVQPRAYGPDIAEKGTDSSRRSGFEISLRRSGRETSITLTFGNCDPASPPLRLHRPRRLTEAVARLVQVPAVLSLVASHGRDILRFLGTGDAGVAIALRDALFPSDDETPPPIAPPDLFCTSDVLPSDPEVPVVVIIPVFNAADEVARLLDRLADTTEDHHQIILIDDGSDDPRVAPMLAAFAARFSQRVTISTFSRNRGFVAAVNHGFDLALKRKGHVVLLNTDTLPPEKWIDRLVAPILRDDRVASVTPMSNTAEIASVPAQGIDTPVTSVLVDRIDAVARRFSPDWSTVEIPTGIGFAMAINRAYLAQLGGFDARFGRGYGEEVDWSQRARANGGRHVLATSIFVGHSGGVSFGSIEKEKRLQANNRIISARYPAYDREIQDWVMAAPHAVQRFALSIAWLDAVSRDPIPIFLAHVLGGGAEMALRRQIDDMMAAGVPGVLVLRVDSTTQWRLEIECAGFRHSCRLRDTDALKDILASLTRRRVVYSCGVGARDPRSIPETLMTLAASDMHSLALQLHDYFPIDPSYCLLDEKGRYRGVRTVSGPDGTCDLPSVAGPARLTTAAWRELWRPVIARANCVSAYSKASADIFLQAYPDAAEKLEIVPHDMPRNMPGKLRPGGQALGILGGINQAKGAAVVLALARHLKQTGSARKIVILGELDPNFRLPAPHLVTGRYDRAEIERLAVKHDIGVWLIPSIWPETFSFTTREALSTGLPVLAFDLGAQGEAVRSAKNGHALTLEPTETRSLAACIEMHFQRV